MRRPAVAALLLVLVASLALGCGAEPAAPDRPGGIPELDAGAFAARMEAAERPMVVNVWASWCIPCRAEAPLLAAAHETHGGHVDFVGVAVEDARADAERFIAEFSVPYENLLDPEASIRTLLGGTGVPITYFLAPGGEVVSTHFGELDEQDLAEGISLLLGT